MQPFKAFTHGAASSSPRTSVLPWMVSAVLDQAADNTEMLEMPGKDTVMSIVSNKGSSHKHMRLPKVPG